MNRSGLVVCGAGAFARVVLIFSLFAMALSAAAQNVTGVVTNGTIGKPASGVEVTLITLGQGMTESGSTKTDAQGKYSLALDGGGGPHLIRATYQGTNYFKMIPPGFTTGNVDIFDSAKKLEGISGNVNIMRMQADSSTLQFMELYAVRNTSSPPRTLVGDTTFEVVLPDGAVIDEADAASPNGQPIATSPVALKQNHYGFAFALKPGETRFQIAYHIPYKGDASVTPKLTLPFDHFVVMTPPSMKVELKNPSLFQPMNDQTGVNVQVTNSVRSGADVSFKVSGTGAMQDAQDAQAPGGAQGGMTANQSATVNRVGPGGGLGAPIDAPDALSQYRWPLLVVMLVVLSGVSYLTLSRTASPVAAGAGKVATPVAQPVQTTSAQQPAPAAAPPKSATALLEAMKEELFALEIERQQGQISQKEYEEQKAALDQTLKRALARSAKNS